MNRGKLSNLAVPTTFSDLDNRAIKLNKNEREKIKERLNSEEMEDLTPGIVL